jgi:dTDP-4-dehydrorhamnose 3,5-epimerase-like enzyme
MYRVFTTEGYDKSAALSQLFIDNGVAHYIHPISDNKIVITVSDLYKPRYVRIYQEILKLVVSVKDEDYY